MREELTRVLNDQFDVRSELRRFELQRVERELARLRAAIERLQNDSDRRNRERGAIIERRIDQLLEDRASGW